ncbi:MAG: transporter [Candidatus Methylomirabilales bacterium]
MTRPNVGTIVATTLPTGDDDLSEDEPQPEVKLAMAWDLSERLSLGSNLSYTYLSADGDRFHQFSGSLSLGYKLTEKWGAYIEYFGFVPETDDGQNASSFDGGFAYLVTNDLQLDARAGVGVFNADSPDYFTGVGVSW